MFPSQMVRLKIVEPSSGPLCPCFPRKWYALKLLNLQVATTFFMFPSQMVCLKIVEPLSEPLISMFPSQMVHLKIVEPSSGPLFNVSLANGTP